MHEFLHQNNQLTKEPIRFVIPESNLSRITHAPVLFSSS